MAKKENTKANEEVKGDAGNIKKRYSLSDEERHKVQNIQSVMGILHLLRNGLQYSMTLEIAKVRDRLGIKESDAPEGFERFVDMDPDKYELLVYDIKKKTPEEIAKEKEEAEKLPN